MAISDRNFSTRLSYSGKVNPIVILIATTMIIFVILMFFRALTYVKLPKGSDITTTFNTDILCWFALPSDIQTLAAHPWTVLTYAFSHIGIWQLFASVLWLWAFGYILIDLTGYKKIVPIFIYGAIAGAITFLGINNFLFSSTTSQYLLGSGTGILAVCAAATTISPNYKILPMLGGGISLWILSIIYLVIDMATLPPDNLSLYMAHTVSALTGFLFIYILRKGVDGSEWMNNLYDWFIDLFNPEKPHKKRESLKSAFFYKPSTNPYIKTPKITQQKLDEILDKINQHGYNQLSEEEKSFLERVSKEDFKSK